MCFSVCDGCIFLLLLNQLYNADFKRKYKVYIYMRIWQTLWTYFICYNPKLNCVTSWLQMDTQRQQRWCRFKWPYLNLIPQDRQWSCWILRPYYHVTEIILVPSLDQRPVYDWRWNELYAWNWQSNVISSVEGNLQYPVSTMIFPAKNNRVVANSFSNSVSIPISLSSVML